MGRLLWVCLVASRHIGSVPHAINSTMVIMSVETAS